MSIIKIREQAVNKLMVPVVGLIVAVMLVGVFVSFSNPGIRGNDKDKSGADKMAFTVGEREYSNSDYYWQIDLVRERLKKAGQPYGITEMARVKGQLINAMIGQAIIAEAARKAGLRAGRSEINKERDNIVNLEIEQLKIEAFGPGGEKRSDKELEDFMRQQGTGSVAGLRSGMAQRVTKQFLSSMVLSRKFEQQVKSKVQMSEADIRNSFRTVNVRHIMVSKSGRPEATAQKRAEEVLAKVKAGGDFAALAKQFSDDPMSNKQGGALPPIAAAPSEYDPMASQFGSKVKEAALRLSKPGDVSGIVEGSNGLHILKLDSSQLTLPKDFDKNKKSITKSVQEQQANQVWRDTVDKLYKEAKITFGNPEFEGYWALGRAQQQMGMPDPKILATAEKAFQRHLLQDTDQAASGTSYIQLAMVQDQLGKTKEAAGTLASGLSERFEDAQARLQLAQLYIKLGEKDKAFEQYKLASEYSNDPMVHYQLRNVFAQQFPNKELEKRSSEIVSNYEQRMKAMQDAQRRALAAQEKAEKAKKQPGQGDNPSGKPPKTGE